MHSVAAVPRAHRLLRGLACAGLAIALGCAAAPLRVGIDADDEPLTFLDAKGQPQGFAVDIMREVAAAMHLEVQFSALPRPALFNELQAGHLDALANVSYTDERARLLTFSAPHLVLKGAAFVRASDRALRSPHDLHDRRIAVRLDDAPHRYLLAHDWTQHIIPTAHLREALHAVAENRAEAALDAGSLGLRLLREEHLDDVMLADFPLTDFALRYHAGFRPGQETVAAAYNEGLARLHANGVYDRAYDRWIGPLDPAHLHAREIRPYLIGAAALALATFGTLLWQRRVLRRLRLQVEARRRSEEQLALVLAGTDDGFWDWDLRTGRVERSERWASMLGYTLAEIPPTFAGGRELVHPQDRQFYDLINSRLNPDDPNRYDVEYRMRTKSGEWRWILNRGKVVARAPDGAALRMAGTHADITDLRRARDEASRLGARFRVVYEHAPVGLSWMRLGQPESRVVNPAYDRITGVSATAGRQPGAYVAATHPDDRARQAELEEKLYRGEIDSLTFEKRYVHADGRVVHALITMHLFRDLVLGETHKVTTLVDLSDRKRTEAEREALNAKMLETQKLESLGVLAGGIAHDFNNLLTVILANASFARDQGELTEERIAPIETAARRAADLCRQMLAYAGKGSVLLEQISLDTLVQETAQLLHVSLSKKARLTLELAPDLPPIEADASQIRQVVMNLVINASEALGDGAGTIWLRAGCARPDPSRAGILHSFDLPPGECLCLEIADTGHGMSPATLSRIFDPFFTTKFTGRGLGLAAVLGIVRAHHGALTVQSELGRGTTFRLYLPAVRRRLPSSPSRPPLPVPHSDGGRGTILIADDEPAVLATVDIMLRREGYQTVLATNGDEAVQHFLAAPDRFAAAVLDLTMPGRDGAEVLASLRAERAHLRVLIMSGFSEADIVERLRGCGDVVILRKPFTQDALLAKIAETFADPPVP